MSKLPQPTYAVPAIPYGAAIVKWLLETVGANTNWWMAHIQPFLEPIMWYAAPGLLLGLIVQDYYNKNSWLHENWRYINRIVDISFLGPTRSPDVGFINLRLQALREMKAGKVRIVASPIAPAGHLPETLVLSEDGISLARAETKEFVVATIPIQKAGWTPQHMIWGANLNSASPNYIIGGAKNMVEFTISAGLRRQKLKFFFVVLNQSDPAFGLVSVTREDIDLFGNKRALAASAGRYWGV